VSGGEGVNDEETMVPESAGDLMNYEIEIDGQWLSVVTEMLATDVHMYCPTCKDKEINDESILYLLDNGQYLYKGMCCGMFALCVANGEDNGLESE